MQERACQLLLANPFQEKPTVLLWEGFYSFVKERASPVKKKLFYHQHITCPLHSTEYSCVMSGTAVAKFQLKREGWDKCRNTNSVAWYCRAPEQPETTCPRTPGLETTCPRVLSQCIIISFWVKPWLVRCSLFSVNTSQLMKTVNANILADIISAVGVYKGIAS